MRSDPTLDNVARNLLHDQCPLTGTMSGLRGDGTQVDNGTTVAETVPHSQDATVEMDESANILCSRCGKWHLCLRNLFAFAACAVPPDEQRLAPRTGLVGSLLRNLHARLGSFRVGGYTADPQGFGNALGQADTTGTESVTAKGEW